MTGKNNLKDSDKIVDKIYCSKKTLREKGTLIMFRRRMKDTDVKTTR